MANILVSILLVVVGFALALGGFVLFRAALYLLGFLLGASVGFVAFTTPSVPEPWGLVILVAAPLAGIGLAVLLRLLLVGSVGALGGVAVTSLLLGVPVVPTSGPPEPLLVLGGLVGLVASYFLRTAIVVFVTASWGSSLVAIGVAVGTSTVVSDPAVLLAEMGVVRILVLLLGLAAQAGLWFYMREYKDDDETAREFFLREAGALL